MLTKEPWLTDEGTTRRGRRQRPPLTPEQLSLRGRMGAYAHAAQGKTNTGPARAAFMARFERQVDPHGELSEAERAKRAEAAFKAHMAGLALASSKARAAKKAAS